MNTDRTACAIFNGRAIFVEFIILLYAVTGCSKSSLCCYVKVLSQLISFSHADIKTSCN